MSYRTLKRLLGETSLERKCRFLFGGGLLILITGSFYFYGKLTAKLVYDQNLITGRMLVTPIIFEKHWRYFENEKDPDFVKVIDDMSKDFKPVDLQNYRWDLVKVTPDDPEKSPADQADYDVLDRLVRGEPEVDKKITEADGTQWYHYYAPVRASTSTLR